MTVQNPSTGHAYGCLASEIGRDPAFPTKYDRTQLSPRAVSPGARPQSLLVDCAKIGTERELRCVRSGLYLVEVQVDACSIEAARLAAHPLSTPPCAPFQSQIDDVSIPDSWAKWLQESRNPTFPMRNLESNIVNLL